MKITLLTTASLLLGAGAMAATSNQTAKTDASTTSPSTMDGASMGGKLKVMELSGDFTTRAYWKSLKPSEWAKQDQLIRDTHANACRLQAKLAQPDVLNADIHARFGLSETGNKVLAVCYTRIKGADGKVARTYYTKEVATRLGWNAKPQGSSGNDAKVPNKTPDAKPKSTTPILPRAVA